MNENKVPENKAYKVTIILLVGLAAFSTAMKDLNRLREMVSSIHGFTSQWQGADLVALNEERISSQAVSTPASTTESCPNSSQQPIGLSDEFGLSNNVVEVRGTIDHKNVTKPEVGAKVEVIGRQKVNRVQTLARARFAPARNSKEQMFAKRRDGHWPAHFEFKTPDRTVTLDLPITMFTDIKADLRTEESANFPQSLLGKMGRKQFRGRSDDGRREFMMKRLERSFSSRRAS